MLARTAFIHHRTGTTVHGDQPKVMKLLGDMSGGEMVVSAYAKHLSTCFGTVQAAPIAGRRARQRERAGQLRGPHAAVDLADAAQAAADRVGPRPASTALVSLRALRDQSLNTAQRSWPRHDGSNIQKQFLDKLATSQTQVRALAEQLGTTLNAITSDDVNGQALAAAALFPANVTPVVTIRIGVRRRQPHRRQPAGRGRPARQRRRAASRR